VRIVLYFYKITSYLDLLMLKNEIINQDKMIIKNIILKIKNKNKE